MKNIQECIYHSLKKYADYIAVDAGENCLKYSDIDTKVNQLMNILYQNCKNEQPRFILMFQDRVNYIISMIAIMFYRGIFIPIDISLPRGKMNQMVEESKADYIIYDSCEVKNEFQEFHAKMICYSWRIEYVNRISMDFHRHRYEQNEPVYIYYTSGTTGKPKGILGKNSGLLHFLEWEVKAFDICEKTRFAQLTSPSFDPFLRDIFVPLISGGTICLLENYYCCQSFMFLFQWIIKKQINIIHCVPSIFHIIVAFSNRTKSNYMDLKTIFLAGEPITLSDVEQWYIYNSHVELVNLYGPTETTLAKLFHIISKEDIKRREIPLGSPIPDTNIYLLDDKDCCSSSGEICIETQYGSLGYMDKSLNDGKFIDSPFHENHTLYRTGDFGKFNCKGEIVFCGRKDRQIKISGISVNLYAVEQCILKSKDITQCHIKLNHKNNRLVCYYTCQNEININEINRRLLYDYQKEFIPHKYIQLEQFKTNANGKIDSDYYENMEGE